ncbi:MAG: hypothetical protein DBX39_06095 [Bacillota bacterium]|nr:MAG: hypothetical protein DBX39_06095 [Bacillota bacterium]
MTAFLFIFLKSYKMRRAREYSRARRYIYNMTISDKMCYRMKGRFYLEQTKFIQNSGLCYRFFRC